MIIAFVSKLSTGNLSPLCGDDGSGGVLLRQPFSVCVIKRAPYPLIYWLSTHSLALSVRLFINSHGKQRSVVQTTRADDALQASFILKLQSEQLQHTGRSCQWRWKVNWIGNEKSWLKASRHMTPSSSSPGWRRKLNNSGRKFISGSFSTLDLDSRLARPRPLRQIETDARNRFVLFTRLPPRPPHVHHLSALPNLHPITRMEKASRSSCVYVSLNGTQLSHASPPSRDIEINWIPLLPMWGSTKSASAKRAKVAGDEQRSARDI